MLFKIIVIGLLIAIMLSLGSGLFHLVKGKGETDGVAKSLTWRIVISVVLFLLLLLAFALGWIKPHGI